MGELADWYIQIERGFCDDCDEPISEDAPICSCYTLVEEDE